MHEKGIEKSLVNLLLAKNLTLSVAESCTGGMLGHCLTNVAGVSTVFLGGIIAYSNEAKKSLLNVDGETLFNYGAVSKEVAVQMAQGAKRQFDTDYALSITGIAGPDGAMPNKPVGLVYVGLASPTELLWQKYLWAGDRESNKRYSVQAALALLQETILKQE